MLTLQLLPLAACGLFPLQVLPGFGLLAEDTFAASIWARVLLACPLALGLLALGFLACALLACSIFPGLGLLALGIGVAFLLLALCILARFRLLAHGALACVLLTQVVGGLSLLLALGLLGLRLARGVMLGLLAPSVGFAFVLLLLLVPVATSAILRHRRRSHAERKGGA